jgi:hypothetical protein
MEKPKTEKNEKKKISDWAKESHHRGKSKNKEGHWSKADGPSPT